MRVRRSGLALCIGVIAIAAAGCGGGSSDGPKTGAASTTTSAGRTFTPSRVEKMIARSIRPALAANLGPGYTLKVECAVAAPGFRCVYRAFTPSGKPVKDQRVVYSVTCDPRCSWIPIG